MNTIDNKPIATDIPNKESDTFNDPKPSQLNGQPLVLQDVLPKLDKPWYKYPYLLKLNMLLLIPMLTSATTGYDGSLLNGLQSLDIWMDYMGNPSGTTLGALTSGVTFGFFLTCWFSTWLSDTHGRKSCILYGAIMMLIGVVIQTAANGYACFIVGRVILGGGVFLSGIGCPTIISETVYPAQREIITSIFNTVWWLGALIAAWITLGTYFINNSWCWRIPVLIQAVSPFIQLVFIPFVPESPRYLVAKSRISDARNVLKKYHTGNDDSEEATTFIDFELYEIQQAIELEKLQKQVGLKTFFKTRANFHRFLISFFLPVMMQLSGNALVSYYLVKVLNSIGITTSVTQLVINGALMCFNQVIAFSATFLTNKVDRRKMFLGCLMSMMVCYLIWTVLSAYNQKRNFEQKSLANGVLAMIFLFDACYDIALSGLPYLYLTEILPYNLRSKGVLVFVCTGQLTGIFNGFVNPVAMDSIEWKYYIVWTCWLAFEIVIAYFLLPETRGYSLEEVAQVFGDGVKDEHREYLDKKLQETKNEIEHVEV